MFRKKKKKQEKQKAQQSPPASPPADQTEDTYDQWIDHTKPQGAQGPPQAEVEDTYDEWIDDAKSSKSKLPPVEDAYDNWVDDAPSSTQPKVEDEYDDWGTTEDAGDQEYEEVEEEGDIFGFDNKKGSSKHSATSPSWVTKPPPVKGTPPSARKMISPQPPQDGDNLEYEDVIGEGDIFGFDNKKASFKNTTSPSWANKAPPVKSALPSAKRPVSMQPPPNLPKSLPPSQRPKSMQSPTYKNVPQSTGSTVQEAEYIVLNSPEEYEVPMSQPNTTQQEEGESYEEMDDLDLKPTYVNVPSQDVGGESYEEMDDLDLKNPNPTSPGAGADFYDDVLPDDHATKKPVVTTSIAEKQQQLQKKEVKEPPKKRGLAADYQKMKFEMLAQKFKEIDSGETKPEPTMSAEKKKATWPPKNSAADEGTPAKGTVTSLTRGFQPNAVNKPKDKAIKGLLWHKAPGRNKYTEEHCELEGPSLKIFRNKNDPKPYFTINTAQCELAAAPEEYEKKHVFKLTAGASRDYFGAFNAGEMKAWMNALKPVVKSAK